MIPWVLPMLGSCYTEFIEPTAGIEPATVGVLFKSDLLCGATIQKTFTLSIYPPPLYRLSYVGFFMLQIYTISLPYASER